MIEQVDSEEFSEGDSVFVQNYSNSHRRTISKKITSYIILHLNQQQFNLGDTLIRYIKGHHHQPQKMFKFDMSFDSFPDVIFNCNTVDPSPKLK